MGLARSKGMLTAHSHVVPFRSAWGCSRNALIAGQLSPHYDGTLSNNSSNNYNNEKKVLNTVCRMWCVPQDNPPQKA